MQDYKKDYRKYSYSENNIQDLDLHKNILLEIPLSINNVILTKPRKTCQENYGYFIFKRFMMFIMHLSLISIFEIIFFFSVIVSYENLSMTNVVDTFAGILTSKCSNFNNTEKYIFSTIINSFINITEITNDASNSLNQRNIKNNIVLGYAWMYFGIITGISLFTIIINFLNFKFFSLQNQELTQPLIISQDIKLNKKHVNLIKIIMDNIIMIILLGLYEYLFFKTVILKYQPISNNELLIYFYNKLDPCLLK
jgi:hypothetical protein